MDQPIEWMVLGILIGLGALLLLAFWAARKWSRPAPVVADEPGILERAMGIQRRPSQAKADGPPQLLSEATRRRQDIQAAGEIRDDEEAEVQLFISQQRISAARTRNRARNNDLLAQFYDRLTIAAEITLVRQVAASGQGLPDLRTLIREFEGSAISGGSLLGRALETGQGQYQLSINGTAVLQGQTRVDVPNGNITVDPAPGARGHDEGTEVTLTLNPTTANSTVRVQGAGRRGQTWVVTMDRDRQVTVTITPPARPQGGGQPTTASAAGAGAIPTPPPIP